MKRKAGQAPSYSSEVRNTALVPVRSGETSNKPAPVRVEATRVPAKSAPKSTGKSGSASAKSAPKSASKSVKAAPKHTKAKKKSKAGLVVGLVAAAVILLGGCRFFLPESQKIGGEISFEQ